MIDVWMGDDFFHNGAFRQTYGYDYVYGMETNKQNSEVATARTGWASRGMATTFSWSAGSFAEDVKKSGSKMLPTWKLFLEHPAYDSVWSSRGVEHHLKSVTVPDAERGRLLRPGRHVGPQKEYYDARAARRQARELSGARTVAPRLLVVVVAPSRQPGLWRADRQGVSRADRGEVLRALSEG